MYWKTTNSKYVLENEHLRVRDDKCLRPDGTVVEHYYSIEKPDVAIIAAFTPEKDLIMIEQYRHPVNSVDLELPAGYIEPSENIAEAAARELLEETGYKADKLIKLDDAFASAGNMTNKVHFFIGHNAKKVSEQKLDASEDINVKILSWPEALKALEEGKIKDLGSIAGMLIIQKCQTSI